MTRAGPGRTERTRRGVAATLAPLALALATTGCVSAGLAAAGPMLAAVVAVADRSVERTLPADMSRSWEATAEVLSRSAIQIKDVDRAGEAWSLTARGESLSVSARLERVTPMLTRLALRAETGGLTADKQTAEVLANQITAALAASSAATSQPPGAGVSTEAVSAIRREIERLGSRMDQSRLPEPQGRVSPAPVEPARVLAVPASAGVPSAPVAASMPVRAPVIEEAERAPSPVWPPVAGQRGSAPPPAATPSSAIVPLLTPVDALRPLEPLSGNGSSTR